MKNLILAVLTVFLLFSCASVRKQEKTTEIEKITEQTKETKRDSISTKKESLPTEGGLQFDLSDLQNMMGDFVQKIKSGGNEATIEKRGDKLIVEVKNQGSSETQTTVKESEKETIYNAEFVKTEFKKIVRSIPFNFWLIIIIGLIVYFRKFIAEILVAIFPVLGTYRFFILMLGGKGLK